MRILTTHAGSLPRPKALVALHVARSRGEAIDEAAFDAAGEAATLDIVRRQREAGVDIPSDGEQLREAFFLYVRRRMSGFGSGWIRPAQRELADYPEFAAARAVALKGREAVGLFQPPMAVGPVRHIAPEENLAEIAGFRAALDAAGPDAFADAFITAPSPGIVASAMKNAFYASDADYLEALGEAPASNTRRPSRTASCCRSTRRTWRWNATWAMPTGRSASSSPSSARWWR